LLTVNYFDQVADRQLTGAQKSKERVRQKWADKRAAKEESILKPSPLQKKQAEKAELLKLYRKWRRGIKEKIIEVHGADFAALMRLLRNLNWSSAERVVEFVRGAQWLIDADAETRFQTINFIDSSFCRSRIREGLAPIDDGLFDEPPTPFLKIRKLLFGV